jgi:hypothetical protein
MWIGFDFALDWICFSFRLYLLRPRKRGEEEGGEGQTEGVQRKHYSIPESLSAFCRIVSLTAAKTSRMFFVFVAWVTL